MIVQYQHVVTKHKLSVIFLEIAVFFLLLLKVRHVGGLFIQLLNKGQKVKRSGWVMTSSLSVCPLRDTWYDCSLFYTMMETYTQYVFFNRLLLFCPQHLSYASGDLMVDASFMQTLWNMNPISSGCELAEGTNLL